MTDQFWYEMSKATREKLRAEWYRLGTEAVGIQSRADAEFVFKRCMKNERPRDDESWGPLGEAFVQGWSDQAHAYLQTAKMDIR